MSLFMASDSFAVVPYEHREQLVAFTRRVFVHLRVLE